MEKEAIIRTNDNHSNICMKCHNAGTGNCSWDKSLTPVEGWTATWDERNETWHVAGCPKFKPDGKHEYTTSGCVGLLIRLAKEAGEEYRDALKELTAANQSGNEYAISIAEGRFALISKFLEGYEADAGHTRVKDKTPQISKEEAQTLYVSDVLNDPSKDSPSTKVRLSKAGYKAKIIAAARPCEKCKYYKLLCAQCKECNFEHSKWKPANKAVYKKRKARMEASL